MPQFEMVEARPGVRIALDIRRPRNMKFPHPGFLWLGGFKSEMSGAKASYLADRAGWGGRPFIRFDYSGHGVSEGRFEDGTISLWLEEAHLALAFAQDWPMIVIGSSMGANLALLLAKRRIGSIKGLVLVAPAVDMTEALMAPQIAADEEARRAIARDGVWMRPSRYGDPYPITAKLIEDGRKHLILPQGLDVDCPVRILHGDEDRDVPWEHGLAAYRAIRSADIQFTLIKGADHRLSRDSDMLAIYNAAERLAL
ncbi:alpha/beta hydrolase [Taklimakanibacter lacteus]|uniref:alpha/beta hydrolase n=1 Tax=Taklimakanibacter lacteus TaxID=2268456 RepID=UPI000E666214